MEAEAECSFFQSWTWIGCRFAERFADPVVLRVRQDSRLVGLALLNRAQGTLWLGESGDAGLDAVYVEHNGILLAGDALGGAMRALLRAGRLRLSGVDAAHLAAAQAAGAVRLRQSHVAPYVDFAALGGADYLATLSANTRAQIRRSDRAYGGVAVQRAATLAEAEAYLAALADLHQTTWTARGRPGAFANPAFTAFHRALLARALPRDEVDLLRVTAADRVVGYLYNFRHRGRVLAYQSGFDYAAAPPHGKPGLTCHHAAIEQARRAGQRCYDFLAGGDRYKTSLANAQTTLHWLEVAPRWSARGLAYRAASGLAGLRRLPIGAR